MLLLASHSPWHLCYKPTQRLLLIQEGFFFAFLWWFDTLPAWRGFETWRNEVKCRARPWVEFWTLESYYLGGWCICVLDSVGLIWVRSWSMIYQGQPHFFPRLYKLRRLQPILSLMIYSWEKHSFALQSSRWPERTHLPLKIRSKLIQ